MALGGARSRAGVTGCARQTAAERLPCCPPCHPHCCQSPEENRILPGTERKTVTCPWAAARLPALGCPGPHIVPQIFMNPESWLPGWLGYRLVLSGAEGGRRHEGPLPRSVKAGGGGGFRVPPDTRQVACSPQGASPTSVPAWGAGCAPVVAPNLGTRRAGRDGGGAVRRVWARPQSAASPPLWQVGWDRRRRSWLQSSALLRAWAGSLSLRARTGRGERRPVPSRSPPPGLSHVSDLCPETEVWAS